MAHLISLNKRPIPCSQAVQSLQTDFTALVVSPGGQCIDVGTGLTVPSAWLVTAPFPVQRLNGSYPDPTVVAGPLSTLATYVKCVGNVSNVMTSYKSVVAALGIRTANGGYDIAMCVHFYI